MFKRRVVDIISKSSFCLEITFQHAKVRLGLTIASSFRSDFWGFAPEKKKIKLGFEKKSSFGNIYALIKNGNENYMFFCFKVQALNFQH